jgi:hypothetical protein
VQDDRLRGEALAGHGHDGGLAEAAEPEHRVRLAIEQTGDEGINHGRPRPCVGVPDTCIPKRLGPVVGQFGV